MKFIVLFLISLNLYSQEIVSCGDGNCVFSGNLNISREAEFVDYSQFEINELEEDVRFEIPNNSRPRDFRGMVRTFKDDGQDLEIDFRSSSKNYDSSNFVLFSDVLDLLQINTDGYNGVISNDSSVICANNTKDGLYGSEAKIQFEQRRNQDQSLANRCDVEDLNILNRESFSCDIGEEVLTQEVVARRWEERANCSADARRFLCLDRRVLLNCEWIADGGSLLNENVCCDNSATSPPGSGWECKTNRCDLGNNKSGWVKTQVKNESDFVYQDDLIKGFSDSQICGKHFPRNTDVDFFYENIEDYGRFDGKFKVEPGSLRTNIKYPNDNVTDYKFLPNLTEYSPGRNPFNCENTPSLCVSIEGGGGVYASGEEFNQELWSGQDDYFLLGTGGNISATHFLSCETDLTRTQCTLKRTGLATDSNGNIITQVLSIGEGWGRWTGFSYFIKYKFLSKDGYVVEVIEGIARGHD